jgi:acetyl-CoA carboxylase carboxyl transferase subunit alpha
VVVFIDTPGAYPGIGAEERGQAQAIAENLRDMAGLRTPVANSVIVSNPLKTLENLKKLVKQI